MIITDVLLALKMGRHPVVITERKEHLLILSKLLAEVPNLFVMHGKMGRKQLIMTKEAYFAIPIDEPKLLLTTGRFLGEGFDDPCLDTLFLTMPISWKGTLAQYAGRLHRIFDQKISVKIYDYVDVNNPTTMKMFGRRSKGYKQIGYEISQENSTLF